MATPLKPSAADRRRPTLWDGVVVLCVMALAAALAFAVFPRQSADHLTAVVTVDGKTVAVLPLYAPSATSESSYFPINDCPYPLVLEYKEGCIRVAESKCPGGDCVRTGWISQVGAQIVCLPNRLVVTLTGEGPASFDAMTG